MAIQYNQQQTQIETLAAELAEYEQRLAALQGAYDEQEKTVKAKDDLLATMGHELRTPLNAMLSLAHVLQDQLGQILTDRQRESFRVIEASGKHLLELINDILDLSKLQAGKMPLKIESVEVEDLCVSALDIVRQQAEQKHLRLSLVQDADVHTIQADQLRIKQVLLNLLSNAVKFTPAEGAVGVEIANDADAGKVHFTVWDTGVGIAAGDLPNLFKPFVQIENSQQRQHTGTGLGLALSQRIARQHGGDICVESTLGMGSRFTLELPWRITDTPVGSSALPIAPLPKSGDDRRRLVLLAEDNEANIFALSEYLALYGVPVIVARTGPEALECALTEHPGLVLMDINLPRLDGLEVIRRLRAIEGFADLPIALTTALSGDHERVLASGANYYLGKPIVLDKLDELLDRYFAADS
jgi:CheY-like chemotaxis protein